MLYCLIGVETDMKIKQCKTFNCSCNCKDCERMRGYKILSRDKEQLKSICGAAIRKGNKTHKEN